VAWEVATYLALVVESAIMVCSLLNQMIVAWAKRKVNLVVEHQVSKSPPQFESQNPIMIVPFLAPKY
jgi:hypothetical protein